MLKSMTGFGRASSDNEGKSYVIELKSVNHRYLDINIRMPRTLNSLEDKIRRVIQEKISRGKIDLFITQSNFSENSGVVIFNKNLADSYLDALMKIKNTYNVRDDITVSLIARFPDVVKVEVTEDSIEEIWCVLNKVLKDAVDNLMTMRVAEGSKLKEDVSLKLTIIENSVKEVKNFSKEIVENYRVKLKDKISDFLQGIQLDEARLSQEVAIFSDRACVDEEIVRLYSHIKQMRDTLNSNEAIGRKLDFIVQEMNREINTIASKANNIYVTNISINVKNEIEKIREQIQNIE